MASCSTAVALAASRRAASCAPLRNCLLAEKPRLNSPVAGLIVPSCVVSRQQHSSSSGKVKRRMADSNPIVGTQPGQPGKVLGSPLGSVLAKAGVEGYAIMLDPTSNRGLAFTPEQRQHYHLEGLLPAGQLDLDTQVARALQAIRSKSTDIGRYIYLQTLQDTNETLYYAMLLRHTHEMMPYVYTPTVGEACLNFHRIYRQTARGMYLNLTQKGRIKEVLNNWPHKEIKAIVFTDGERILGLGDLGVNGMGIPIGKLALYTACAGVPPLNCLPVHIDMGTNNEELRNDPFYMGLRQPRASAEEYDEFIAEFVQAAQELYGRNVMLQFEDFGNTNAFRLLHAFQDKACTFNDDIQGTASVVVAGLLTSVHLTNKPLREHTFLFLGAGEAGIGIADLIAYTIEREEGISLEEARSKIWLVDSKGLVVSSRMSQLQEHKRHYAHEHDPQPDFISAIRSLRPTCILGVSAQPATFNEEVCRAMAEYNEHPIIFALSNPTSKAECTAEQAYQWTDGRCIFASGSPFAPVDYNGKTFIPGQGNNAYIFPGIGLGAIAAGSTKIDDEDMYIAAKTLSEQVTPDRLAVGCVYPPLEDIREVSARIAAALVENSYRRGTATVLPKPDDVLAHVRSVMYNPIYS